MKGEPISAVSTVILAAANDRCTAVLSGTLGHNEDGYAPESTAAIIQWLQSLKLGGE